VTQAVKIGLCETMTPHFRGIWMKFNAQEMVDRMNSVLAHPNKTVEQRAAALRAKEIAQAFLKPGPQASNPSSPALPPSPPESIITSAPPRNDEGHPIQVQRQTVVEWLVSTLVVAYFRNPIVSMFCVLIIWSILVNWMANYVG
jgi:hypothetical protein